MSIKRLLSKLLYIKRCSGIKACGKGVQIERGVEIHYKERMIIGDYVYVGPKCFFNSRGDIVIGSYSIFGPEVVLLSSMHNYKDTLMIPYDEVENLKSIKIGDGVWIGMRSVIMPGVELGEGCIVGTGAIVTKSFLAGSIIAGNPAKIIGQRDMELYYKCKKGELYYLKLKTEMGLRKREQRL